MFDVVATLASAVLFAVFSVPQIVRTARTKSTSGIALSTWVLVSIAVCLNVLVMFSKSASYLVIIPQAINLAGCLVVVNQVMYFRYYRKPVIPISKRVGR